MTASSPRLVATDLDGTIVRSDGTISPRTVAALSRAEQAGARVVLVTGRPPRFMGSVVTAFGGRGDAICSNGALIYDMQADRIVAEHLITPQDLAVAAARLRAAIPGIGLAIESARELAGDARYEVGGWDGGGHIRRLADAELFSLPAAKLLGRHPRLSADELLALATPAVAGLATVSHSSGARLIEISAAGVSKASALADLATRQGIAPAAAVAFGDMPNDLSMLAWAGRSYAVANAHPDVLAAAGQVIPGNDEDGVAQVIEHLFPAPLPEATRTAGPGSRPSATACLSS
jgi:hydroxymethylpyrimidine pyrophosphatase-like HAD family hydrolase